jgi:hypothetical protein
MEGNEIQYAVRLTFGVVHGVLLTLISFALALLYPSFSHFLFSLFGCVIAPAASLLLTFVCNACIEYTSKSNVTLRGIFHRSWAPPLGIFLVSLLILPLEMMHSSWLGPLNALAATSVAVNCLLATLLQIYIARDLQSSSESSATLGALNGVSGISSSGAAGAVAPK